MLALTDAKLAYSAIVASRVQRGRRKQQARRHQEQEVATSGGKKLRSE
jgi:hypothetical protein